VVRSIHTKSKLSEAFSLAITREWQYFVIRETEKICETSDYFFELIWLVA